MSMEPLVTVITATVDTRLNELVQNKKKYTCPNQGNNTMILHHETVYVWFPTDAVQRWFVLCYTGVAHCWNLVHIRHFTILREENLIQTFEDY